MKGALLASRPSASLSNQHMTENTIKIYYKKERIVLMLVGLIAIISLAAFIWPFLNEPHLVIRRGMIIIIWILAIYSGIIMISSLFSHKPAIVIDVKGFEVSRLLGGVGRLDWSNIKSLRLRNSKIKVVLNDANLVRNKYLAKHHTYPKNIFN